MTQDWLWTAIALLPPLLVCIIAAGRQAAALRFTAIALASSFAIALLLMLSFAFDQSSSTDLALTLALLTLPGTLVFALFEERWL